jgi:hypothetical protein
MMSFSIKIFQPDSTEITEQPLKLNKNQPECTIRLRTPAGASGLHLLILESGKPKLRMEIATHKDEEVNLMVVLDKEGNPHILEKDGFILPISEHYSPVQLIYLPNKIQQLDIVMIVDATMRIFADETITENNEEKRSYLAKLLIDADKPTWETYIEKLSGFIENISKKKDYKISILSFGDYKQPQISAPELIPKYIIKPEEERERSLQLLEPKQIMRNLRSIEATSGGDFVDALADAMIACIDLNWRNDARKLLIIFGDSPGHSIMYPTPKGGDLCARQIDVDTVAMHLHQLGIEILTIYNAPSEEAYDYFKEVQGSGFELLDHTKKQYQQLASLPELAFQIANFDPIKAAKIFSNWMVPIGRGMVFGEINL